MGGVKNDIKKGFAGIPNLQEVHDEGNTITNGINTTILSDNGINTTDSSDSMSLTKSVLIFSNGIDDFSVDKGGFTFTNGTDNLTASKTALLLFDTDKSLELTKNYVSIADTDNVFVVYPDKINVNFVDYPLPTGVSSQIATLADISDSFNAENLGGAIYNNLSIKLIPSDDDEFLVYDSITGEAVTIKYSDIKTPTESSRSTATSGTENAPNTSKDVVFIHEAGATASLTFTFPPSPTNNQKVTIMSVGGITTLTLTASVGTIINAITTLAIGGSATYMYLASQTKWYKIA